MRKPVRSYSQIFDEQNVDSFLVTGYIRILIDGYNLLHAWPDLAKGYPRYSEEARDELRFILQQFQDHSGIQVTLIFDGKGKKSPTKRSNKLKKKARESDMMEVLFSPSGISADNVIERLACRLAEYGKVLVVSNDSIEKSTVRSFGADTMGCQNFINEISRCEVSFSEKINRHNSKEKSNFHR